MSTTIDTITDYQIRTLSAGAAVAGDLAQVEICDRALGGNEEAKRECARVIRLAEAMAEEGEDGGMCECGVWMEPGDAPHECGAQSCGEDEDEEA